MIINLDSQASIFFGDASTCPVSHKHEVQFRDFCNSLRQQFGLQKLVVLHQVHGTDGLVIDDRDDVSTSVSYKDREGDFLITHQSGIGLGVITADCLPIIFYVPERKIIAAVHAGWRGSLAGVAVKVLTEIIEWYSTVPGKIQVYFGPAARSCCYEVQPDFLANIPDNHQDTFINREGKYFFDNSLFNKQQLLKHGVLPKNIYDQYNLCTICNTQFHSYRRCSDKENFKTELTIVWLQ